MDELQKWLTGRADVRIGILYGSTVTGGLRPDSDIDLAVYLDHPTDAGQKMEMIRELASITNRPVDLVDLRMCHGTLLNQVLETGEILLNRNPEVLEQLNLRRMYENQDVRPYVRRTLMERVERFAHGS